MILKRHLVPLCSTLLAACLVCGPAMAGSVRQFGDGGGAGKVLSGDGGGAGRSAQLGIQLSPAAASRLGAANASEEGVVVDARKLDAAGFTGAKAGDKVRITTIVPGQQWRVMHLGSRAEHTFEAAGQMLNKLR